MDRGTTIARVLVSALILAATTVSVPAALATPDIQTRTAATEAGRSAGESRTLRNKVRVFTRTKHGATIYRARARAVVRHRIVLNSPGPETVAASARAGRTARAIRPRRVAAARAAARSAVRRAGSAARRKAVRKLTAAHPASAQPTDIRAPGGGLSPPESLPDSQHGTYPADPPRGAPVVGLNVWDVGSWDRAEDALGFRAGVVGLFADFAHSPDFPQEMAARIAARGASPLIAWEPWDSHTATVDQPGYRLRSIIDGDHDALIRRWATQVDSFGHKVLIRFAPEMNGDWRPWSPGVNGNTTGQYARAWRHVVGIFADQGAHNAVWVWNPIVESGGHTPMSEVYPGDDVVDLVALDGYNWGTTRPWGWQGYDDIFAESVTALGRIAPGKPWLIAEVGCAPGAGKPDWILELFARAKADGARAVVWFEFDKETDWRLSANAATSAAARQATTESGWLTGGDHALTDAQW